MDTPGIGGSGEVTPKLMDYLPCAVSFIFVINIGSAGGLQTDRVNIIISYAFTDILKKIIKCIWRSEFHNVHSQDRGNYKSRIINTHILPSLLRFC